MKKLLLLTTVIFFCLTIKAFACNPYTKSLKPGTFCNGRWIAVCQATVGYGQGEWIWICTPHH